MAASESTTTAPRINYAVSRSAGRTGSLPAASKGATRAALLYSVVQSCTLIDVSPFDYLKDVLLRVATHPHRMIADLTPKGWAATFGQRAAA
jgi:transposase